MDRPRILLVDDDRRLRDLLERYLGEQGFEPACAENGEEMDRLLADRAHHALVLDLMLPGEDGLSICRRLRAHGNPIPILILTARGDEIDRIVGLEMGADDYLPKPFNPRELVARLRAILRRNRPPEKPAETASDRDAALEFGPCRIEFDQHRLLRGGETVRLTSGEFALLRALAEHPGRPQSRDALLNLTRGRDHDPYDRSVDVLVSRLRRLIEPDPAKPRYLQTVRGVGYLFDPDGKRR